MKFILEYKNYYKEGDIVLIEYWYNHMITPVKIIEKMKRGYRISHDISDSKIQNAPEQSIKNSEIIAPFRGW